jgi:hypothetical protein
MRFRLRTLLIVLAVGPVVLAVLYWSDQAYEAYRIRTLRHWDEMAVEGLLDDKPRQTVSPLP